MYQAIDAENFFSFAFFIVAILVLNFWLINLFVAVITNTFSAIRGDTNKSAFGAAPLGPIVDEDEDAGAGARRNIIKEVYEHVRWCWVALALASLVLQATRTVNMSSLHQQILEKGELVLTIAFDLEMILRFCAEFPDWREFFAHANNLFDLFLAVGSTIIQVPIIRDSEVYPYLTFFQLARFYRVILEVPRMKPLMVR
jgi:voltage-dependent calcium channel